MDSALRLQEISKKKDTPSPVSEPEQEKKCFHEGGNVCNLPWMLSYQLEITHSKYQESKSSF